MNTMKHIFLILFTLIAFSSIGQNEEKQYDSRLIGKWEFNKVEITFRSDRDREAWKEPFYIVFAKDGSLLMVIDTFRKADKWSTKEIDELKLEDAERMNYSLVNDDILILGIENTLISLKRVKCNWKKEQVLLDSALAVYELAKLEKLNKYKRESMEMESYDDYEMEEVEEEVPDFDNEVFEIFNVQSKAEYPGGEESLKEFIDKNVVYPPMAKENKIEGTISVMFVINEKGEVHDLVIIGRKVGFGLEEEAMRIIKMTSGQWKPAMQRDRPVKMRFRIPVKFEL